MVFGNRWKPLLLSGVVLSISSFAPPVVLAQDDVTDENVKLSPEKPIAAPMPAPSAYGSNESSPEGEDANRPFQYPTYPAYGGYAPQPQYGEPYTRPGYYPSGSPDYEPPSSYPQYGQGAQTSYQTPYYRGGITVVPQGLVIPIDLRTAISTQVAKAGDYIEATVNQNVPLNGTGYLPAGTVISGQVTEAKAGRRLSRSGSLSIAFNNLRLPSGASYPMSAHLIGTIGRYKDVNGVERGEGWKAKLGQFALRGVGGAGLGAALGTGLGAIVNGGSGAGTGAWAGAAFGGGLGAMDMLLRKGRDVIIPSGTEMKLQMDEPLSLPMSS